MTGAGEDSEGSRTGGREAALALYHYDGCGYCRRVRAAIERLDIEVEYADIYADPGRLRELLDARGRATVPVLRIREDDGGAEWLAESAQIIAYLEERFG